MICNDCGKTITICVKLSETYRLCEQCYIESLAAYHEETAGQPYQSLPGYCPSPEELHERIAETKRASLAAMSDGRVRNGKLHYEPRTTTSNMQRRRGTEGRTV